MGGSLWEKNIPRSSIWTCFVATFDYISHKTFCLSATRHPLRSQLHSLLLALLQVQNSHKRVKISPTMGPIMAFPLVMSECVRVFFLVVNKSCQSHEHSHYKWSWHEHWRTNCSGYSTVCHSAAIRLLDGCPNPSHHYTDVAGKLLSFALWDGCRRTSCHLAPPNHQRMQTICLMLSWLVVCTSPATNSWQLTVPGKDK